MPDSNPPNQTDQKGDDPKTVNSSDSGAKDGTSADSQEPISMDTVADGGKDLPLEDLDRKKDK